MSVKSIFSKTALLKLAIILPSFILLTISCSNDDNDNGGSGKEEINLNKNEVTTDKAVTRLEFPRLKGGNSIVLISGPKAINSMTKTKSTIVSNGTVARNRSAGRAIRCTKATPEITVV